MNHRSRLIACALAALLAAGTLTAGAQERTHAGAGGGRPEGPPPMGEGGPPPGPPAWMVVPQQLERLGLTEAQRRRLDEVRATEAVTVDKLEPQLREAERELTRLVEADASSSSEITAAAGRVSALHGQMMLAHVTARIGLRDLLTAEQRAKLRSLPKPQRGRPERPDDDGPGR